jgi:hypothetical protein
VHLEDAEAILCAEQEISEGCLMDSIDVQIPSQDDETFSSVDTGIVVLEPVEIPPQLPLADTQAVSPVPLEQVLP